MLATPDHFGIVAMSVPLPQDGLTKVLPSAGDLPEAQ